MAVTKIISGGQTGADIGGLRAAEIVGIKTGGCMPLGFLTEQGKRPDYKERFGITEHYSPKYHLRTEINVVESDGTVRIAGNFHSRGEACTLRAIKKHGKPYFDVNVKNPPQVSKFIEWLTNNNVSILNVAGNAESTWPGTEEFAEQYIISALKALTY